MRVSLCPGSSDFAAFPDDLGRAGRDASTTSGWSSRASRRGRGPRRRRRRPGRVEISAIEGPTSIRLVTVEAGTASPLEVVCGAWNFEVGYLVPLAPVGAVLPGGFEIARRKMRGVTSNGMLCSGRELGVGDDHEGLLVLDEVPGAVPGRPLIDVLGIEPDVVLDITVEGNRPDAWCMAGIARDLAARLDSLPLPVPPAPAGASDAGRRSCAVEISTTPDLCPRFTVTVLSGVEVGPSPRWLARRLGAGRHAADQQRRRRLELRDARARPAHPPLRPRPRSAGRGFVVRRAPRPARRSSSLDGSVLELARATGALGDTGEDLVICDADDVPIGLAGVMGGRPREIPDVTTSVVLEAAWFEPMADRTERQAPPACAPRPRRASSAAATRWLAGSAAARFAELLRETLPASPSRPSRSTPAA